MAKRANYDAEPHPVLAILAKVLGSKRGGEALGSDRSRALMKPGDEQHLAGLITFEADYSVGEDSTTMRSYGVPIDSIIELGMYLCGAMRPFLMKAAFVVREVRTAELEERDLQAVTYEYDDKPVTIPVEEVKELAVALAEKLAEKQDVLGLSEKIKVERPYQGPVNIQSASIEVIEGSIAAEVLQELLKAA